MVDDADALHEACRQHGLRIIKRLQDKDYGLQAFVFEDPDGNRIDVGQPLQTSRLAGQISGAGGGTRTHTTLPSRDFKSLASTSSATSAFGRQIKYLSNFPEKWNGLASTPVALLPLASAQVKAKPQSGHGRLL